jgi:hypothetical protein
MKCNHEWTVQFLMNNFTKTFMNTEYKRHREQFLFEREQARLPEAQHLLSVRKQRDHAVEEAEQLRTMWLDKLAEARNLNRQWAGQDVQNFSKTGYTRHCPLEDCRGFLNRQWKCGVCEKSICAQCHELKLDGHECNPETLATARLIHNDSRPCPKCGMYIQKVEGCNQMWCTDCHTAFDWRSGNIVTGTIHNPHFYEARRQAQIQGRNVNDVPCGGLPTQWEFSDMGFKDATQFPRNVISLVCAVEGYIVHPQEPNNLTHRISFLENEIDEKKFRSLIRASDKRYHKRRELDDVYQMVVTTLSDILRKIVTDKSYCDQAENEICGILNYANTALSEIATKYGSTADNGIYMRFFERYKTLRYTTNNKNKTDEEKAQGFFFAPGVTFHPSYPTKNREYLDRY